MHLTSDSFIPPNSGILEEEVDDFDNSATIKAKNFFHSCMDMSKQEWSNLVGRDAPFWEIHQAQGPLENTPKSAFLVIIFGHFLSEMAFKGHFRQTVASSPNWNNHKEKSDEKCDSWGRAFHNT